MAEYAKADVLVSTQWVAEHANDPKMRLVEVDVDTSAYDQGHVPGAVGWNWQTQLQDALRRDLVDKSAFEKLCGEAGIANDTTVVVYGDNNNWFAAWAFWQFQYYGHQDARLMNGGRKKWIEEKRPLTTEKPPVKATSYTAKEPDASVRARRG
ncbi:MAG: rhodanese-like domain-containing protein [Candidatus Acidoferrales bacterium]